MRNKGACNLEVKPSEIRRGKAQLRDMSAAQGLYEVEYVLHVNTQTTKNIGRKSAVRTAISANIQLINGYALRNGFYSLEVDGESLHILEKAGTHWRIMPDKA